MAGALVARNLGRLKGSLRTELTSREVEIITLVRNGYNNRKIAQELGLSIHTVRGHRKHALEKLRTEGDGELNKVS